MIKISLVVSETPVPLEGWNKACSENSDNDLQISNDEIELKIVPLTGKGE